MLGQCRINRPETRSSVGCVGSAAFFAIFSFKKIMEIKLELIRDWLFKIDEPESDHALILDKCRSNPEAMAYFLKHARGEFAGGAKI